MADKDDFSFDKDSKSEPAASPAAAPGKKVQPVPSRALLLGLLLVVLGGAAYFYSVEMMAPQEVAVPAEVTKQLITPPPAPAATPATESAATTKDPPAADTAGQTPATAADSATATATESQPIAKEAPKLAEKGVLQEIPVEAPKPTPEAVTSAAAAAGQTGAASPAVADAAPPPAAAPAAVETKAAPAVAGKPARGAFTLLAGAYLSPELLQSASKKVRSLGYQPRTLRDAKMVEMTRTRLGAFAPAEAQAKLAELKKIAPDAFTLPEGEQVAVYAASHFNQKAHNAFAEKLRQAGVAFEEEKAMRKLPITELSFGDFNDRAAAEKAAAKARQAGLDIIVLKRP
ncbi:MAG: SPOR domain-containing protein [Trichloromonadaceae bacterium]